MSDKKRSWEGPGESSISKKQKSEPTSSNGTLAPSALSGDDIIIQKRKEVAAKLAAMKLNALGKAGSATISAPPRPAAPKSALMPNDIARRIAEAKGKVAAKMPALRSKGTPEALTAQQSGGLSMAAHPLLLDTSVPAPQSKKDRYKPMQPKFSSVKANVRNAPAPAPVPVAAPVVEVSSNPYTAGSSAAKLELEGAAPRDRTGRNFRFVPKGKYVQLGNQLRQDTQLEALKQRIAESARKAGMDSEFETLEKNIRRAAPPEVEWWDAALLPNKTYDDLVKGVNHLNIYHEDSPITMYIQHPIPIPAPGEKNKPELKPLMLTKKEQKKLRRQRRQAELQDKRDRVRMGLIPPDAPKVRLANLMKVLTSDAIQDPTRVEARVRREVAMRKHGHEKMNAERKLTDEQRREKVENKKVDEEKKGIYAAVFKIKTLSDPAHKFKVRKNAEQMNLTGVCIFNPGFSMVYVEGASKFIRNFKKLMMKRMAWTEAARPRDEVELQGTGSDDEMAVAPTPETPAEVVSLEDNKCWLIWEGQLRDRAFNGFKPKTCATDGAAKEVLGMKLAGYWDQAKNWKVEEEEAY